MKAFTNKNWKITGPIKNGSNLGSEGKSIVVNAWIATSSAESYLTV